MTEDLSAQVRLGVSYVILSTITVFVVSAVMVATISLQSMLNNVNVSVTYMEQGALEASAGRTISGAACYRICKDVYGAIDDFEIKVTTGGNHTYYDVEDLMKNDLVGLQFYFNAYSDDGATWTIKLQEVTY